LHPLVKRFQMDVNVFGCARGRREKQAYKFS